MTEKLLDGQAAVTLKTFDPHVGDQVRRMLIGSQIGRYPEPLLWQVLGIETSGCVVALTAGQDTLGTGFLLGAGCGVLGAWGWSWVLGTGR